MKISEIKTINKISMHGGHSASGRHRDNLGESEVYKNNRPANASALSGSERLYKKNDIAFTGDPKLVQHIATDVLKKGGEKIPQWAEKMGGANWFSKVLKSVDKNEAFYEAAVALGVAGVLKPICVLAMPGAEREDKEMAATKNAVSAGIGFILSNLILSPCSNAVNRITDSFHSANPTEYIKDAKYVQALKSSDIATGAKSTIGDAYKSAFKKFPDLGVSPLKAGITIALTPIVLKVLFGKDKKSKDKKDPVPNSMSQMPVMNAIRIDSNNSSNSPVADNNTKQIAASSKPSFKGNINQSPSFTGDKVSETIELAAEAAKKNKHLLGKAKDAYTNALGAPLAKIFGKLSTTKPAQWVVEQTSHFEKPSPRWSDLASIAITFFYINNTRKSEKIDEERKLPLMINNGMVTVASSVAAFLIDKYTDKPMDHLLRGYLTKHEADLHNKSNVHIKSVLNNVKDMANPTPVEANSVKQLLENGKEILGSGVDEGSGFLKDAINALRNDATVQEAIEKGLIKGEEVAQMAAAGFSQQASKVYKNMSKTKSLTIFTITVRFLVTVLMTPVIGKVVALVNKKLGKTDGKGKDKKVQDSSIPQAGSETIGMKDYMNSLKK